jgi:poly(A) polymerase
LLEWIDAQIAEHGSIDDSVLWTVLLLEPLKEALDGERDRGAACVSFLEPLVERLAIPRRHIDTVRRIVSLLPRIHAGRTARIARGEVFELTLLVADAELCSVGASSAKRRAVRAELGASRSPSSPPSDERRGARGSARTGDAEPERTGRAPRAR